MRHIDPGCPCRTHEHPAPLDIAPGLEHLPRRVAGFGELRRAMLGEASRLGPLDTWSAREPGDLGVLLIEMWAVACSIVAFADETICHECYIRTARRETSLRDLIRRLGYRPRPAVAATVHLSVQVDGRNAVSLPAGTPFRSGAVGDTPPQVFESLTELSVHPLASRFTVPRRRVRRIGDAGGTGGGGTGGGGGSTVELGEVTALIDGVGLAEGALVQVMVGSTGHYRRLEGVAKVRGPGPKRATITFDQPLSIPAEIEWDDVAIQVADRTHLLWTLDVPEHTQPGVSTVGSTTTLTLDGQYRQFGEGDRITLSLGAHTRWFVVDEVGEASYRLAGDVTFEIDGSDQTVPAPTTVVTQLVLDASINDADRRTASADTSSWTDTHASQIQVRSGWRTAATLDAPFETEIAADGSEPVSVGEELDQPWTEHHPERFTVVDRDGRSVTATGALDWDTGDLVLDETAWDPPLRHPIRVEANVVTATRGESVFGEVLGSGDASIASQAFSLANAPLTHLGPAAASGDELAVSTLVIWVDRVRWTEVPHFVGCGPSDRVYVTRQADDGGTDVVFGDGLRGARLPTGTDNVMADYRWGAGSVHPPANSIAQLVDPVEHVTGVVNRSAAFGGSDPEPPEEIRGNAPRSAVLLGRIVSRDDAVAAATAIPDVRVATAEWDWDAARLQAGILVRFVGDAGLVEGVRRRLRALAERDVRIDAVVSPPQEVTVTVTVVPDPRRIRADVEAAVREALVGEGGALTPEVLGVNGPLFRSRLMAAVMDADGVIAVTGALVDGAVFDAVAVAPPAGGHLDGTAGVTVVVEEVPHA